MRPRKFFRACFILLLFCLQSGGAHAVPRDEELDTLRARIKELQQELEKTSESKSEVTDALRESERAISNSNRALAKLEQQQAEARSRLLQLQQQSLGLEHDIQSQQALLGRLLYQEYLGGRQEYLKMLLNNRDPDQAARDAVYYEYIAKSRAVWLNLLRANLSQLRDVADETRQKSAEIAELQAKQQQQRQALERDKHARQEVLKKISLQLKKQRRDLGHLQRDENRLARLVAKLSHMLAPKPGAHEFRNNQLPDERFDGSPFEALKGRLALPVKGVVTNRFGTQRPESTVLWKGLFLRAPANSPVKAVAAGRVVFADWLRGFGNLMIVDHGHGYMSLYGNNETLYKEVGEVLHGGDVIAAVGNSGGNEDSGLYFELRHEGEPMDPMKWVAR